MGKKSVSEGTKWKIVGIYENIKLSYREIAKRIGVSEFCVRSTLKKYKNNKQIKDLPRIGPPKKLSFRQERVIFRIAREHFKWSYQKIANEFNIRYYKYWMSNNLIFTSV